MENGEWRMENGKWRMENGEWRGWILFSQFSIFRFQIFVKHYLRSMLRKGLVWLVCLACIAGYGQELQVMSFNIRYDNDSDPLLWENRKDEVASTILFHDIIGVQEALHHQVMDIADRLPAHDWYGVGRDDGKAQGEYAPIFYNTQKFELVRGETIWLSETPTIPGSVGWDAQLPRIATVAILIHKETRKTIRVVNTHFSHVGEDARLNASWLIRGYATSASQDHVIVLGDFNVEEEDPAYAVLNQEPLIDSYYSSATRCRPKYFTYAGFDPNENQKKRIDHIFSNIETISWICIDEQIKWGFYISDHLPVFIVFNL